MSDRGGYIALVLGRSSKDCRVEMDGKDISHLVRGVKVVADVHHVTTIHLDLMPSRVDIRVAGDVDVLARLYDPHARSLSRAKRTRVGRQRPPVVAP